MNAQGLNTPEEIARWRRQSEKFRAERAERERIGADHRAAHDNAGEYERNAVELLAEGKTAEATVVALLAVSVRLDELCSRVEDLAEGGLA